MDKKERKRLPHQRLAPEDYYLNEQGLVVFTEVYHRKRGYCCQSGCKHCPYGYRKDKKEEA